jgi:hypothetical protein
MKALENLEKQKRDYDSTFRWFSKSLEMKMDKFLMWMIVILDIK